MRTRGLLGEELGARGGSDYQGFFFFFARFSNWG